MAYEKNTWAADDVITATKLNNMETGIEANDQAVADISENFSYENGIKMGENSKGVELIDEGMINNSVNSIVFGLVTKNNGYTYKTDIQNKAVRVIVMGPVKITGSKSNLLALAQLTKLASQNIITTYPHLSEHVDENLVFQPHIGSGITLTGGANYNYGPNSIDWGSCNVTTSSGACSISVGQYNHTAAAMSATIGEGVESGSRCQFCVGRANNNKAEDVFEIGNGLADTSAGTISRSNAFRVTFNGDAIAQNSLGIEDGNGGVVTITAAQLQALLALLPQE